MVIDINNPKNKYSLIYADPPWKQTKGGKKSVRKNSSGTELDYPTLGLEDITEHLKISRLNEHIIKHLKMIYILKFITR